MTEKSAKQAIIHLTKLINHHNHLYFQKNKPEITDYDYDQLLARLRQLELQFPDFKKKDSPTQRIGEGISKNFEVVPHTYPMLSLSNTYSVAEVAQFVQRIEKLLPNEAIDFFCELKFDGVAISLVYNWGHLVRVVTRGDGEQGDNITKNGLQIQHIPQYISGASKIASFETRGEAFMPHQEFENMNKKREANGDTPLANPRNTTAGTLKVLDPTIVAKRGIDCYLYTLYAEKLPSKTHEEGIHLLAQWGFNISPTYKKCNDLTEIVAYINYWSQHKKDLPLDIDGIVIKVNSIDQQKRLGSTAKSPRWAIAYKYAPEQLTTLLQKVTYQVGRTGRITPVAHFAPIHLGGTLVKRASLHNANEIARKGIHIRDTLLVEKGGEIIPKIAGIDPTKREKDSQPLQFATHCPACGTLLIQQGEEVAYYCPNYSACRPQLEGSIIHFVQRKGMAIDALGPRIITLLFEKGLLRTPADLYTLTYEQVVALPGFKEVAARKLLRNIELSKKITFERVLFALGIKHVGIEAAKTLASHFKSITALAAADSNHITTLPMMGHTIANSVVAYFQHSDNIQLIHKLEKAGLQLHLINKKGYPPSGQLVGKKIVISGTFAQFSREEIKKIIADNGGQIVTSLSTQVAYLVAGHKAGAAKLEKASVLNIPVLAEDDISHIIS